MVDFHTRDTTRTKPFWRKSEFFVYFLALVFHIFILISYSYPYAISSQKCIKRAQRNHWTWMVAQIIKLLNTNQSTFHFPQEINPCWQPSRVSVTKSFECERNQNGFNGNTWKSIYSTIWENVIAHFMLLSEF